MSLNCYIAKQFSNPAGVGGRMISFVVNRQNHPLYEETISSLRKIHIAISCEFQFNLFVKAILVFFSSRRVSNWSAGEGGGRSQDDKPELVLVDQ